MIFKDTGISDFKEIIEKNMVYVDNTLLVKDIIDNKNKIFYIVKESKRGKSLDLSMLSEYFAINKNSEKLFKGLNILKEDKKYIEKMNKYPVVYINFKNCAEDKFNLFLYSIKNIIMDLYIKNHYLLDEYVLYKGERKQFDNIISLRPNEYELKTSILLITKLLNRYYDKKVILLIDDYDIPIINSSEKEFENDIIKFLSELYKYTIKDNSYIEKVIIAMSKKIDII